MSYQQYLTRIPCKQAFALCEVPGTEYNLSHTSLTSRSARQAILDLRTTNPELYADITSGHHPPPPPAADEDIIPEPDDVPVNEDVDHTVEEVCSVILNARSADEAARVLAEVPEFDDEEPEQDKEAILPPASPATVTRSGRASRRPSRYNHTNWRRH